MVVDVRPRTEDIVSIRRQASTPRKRLGSYMPFAGVKYYAIFDDEDIAEGRHGIGHVGWRVSPAPDVAEDAREASVAA